MKMVLILFVLLVGLFFSNPTAEDHQLAVKDSLVESYRPTKNFSRILADITAYGITSVVVKRNDFYLFSLCEVKGITIGFGILKHVFVFDKQLKKATNTND